VDRDRDRAVWDCRLFDAHPAAPGISRAVTDDAVTTLIVRLLGPCADQEFDRIATEKQRGRW